MPSVSIVYTEDELKALVQEHIEQAERRAVKSISFTFDRPPYPTPTDPGSGVTMRVELGDVMPPKPVMRKASEPDSADVMSRIARAAQTMAARTW